MIAFPSLLVEPARQAGISVPEDVDNYNPMEYKRWHLYMIVQLGASMPSPGSHWNNARVIAAIPEDELMTIAFGELVELGLETGHPVP